MKRLRPAWLGKKQLALILICLQLLGLCLRVYRLGDIGFSEDESRKIAAVASYRNGDISANAEHPMILKSLILASTSAAHTWNSTVASHDYWWDAVGSISEEAAARLPNAFFGAATALPLYLLAESFFGVEIGLLTAAFWSLGINSVSFNRIAKEDTLMIFFTLLAFYFYRRAKLLGNRDDASRNRFYLLSGAVFGLQLASKYIPGYLGLLVLYYHLFGRKRQNQPIPPKVLLKFFLALGLMFLVVNPAILMPSVWHYIAQYSSEKFIQHHGYLFMGKLYYNNFKSIPFGLPAYFYALFLAIKTPLPSLLLFVCGIVHVFRFPHGPGRYFLRFMFIWWMIPYSLMGGKWLRYGFSYVPYFYMTAAVGFAVMWREFKNISALFHRLCDRLPQARWALASILLFVLMFQVCISLPAPLLYVNSLGGGSAFAGKYFTTEELYDAGFREAYSYLASHAKPGSTIATDADAVFKYYSQRFQRADLKQIPLCYAWRTGSNVPLYAIVHDGNRFFENEPIFKYLKSHRMPILTASLANFTVLRMYEVNPEDFQLAERLYPMQGQKTVVLAYSLDHQSK